MKASQSTNTTPPPIALLAISNETSPTQTPPNSYCSPPAGDQTNVSNNSSYRNAGRSASPGIPPPLLPLRNAEADTSGQLPTTSTTTTRQRFEDRNTSPSLMIPDLLDLESSPALIFGNAANNIPGGQTLTRRPLLARRSHNNLYHDLPHDNDIVFHHSSRRHQAEVDYHETNGRIQEENEDEYDDSDDDGFDMEVMAAFMSCPTSYSNHNGRENYNINARAMLEEDENNISFDTTTTASEDLPRMWSGPPSASTLHYCAAPAPTIITRASTTNITLASITRAITKPRFTRSSSDGQLFITKNGTAKHDIATNPTICRHSRGAMTTRSGSHSVADLTSSSHAAVSGILTPHNPRVLANLDLSTV